MCYVVLKYMKCSVSAMWMWWSCNEYFFTYLYDLLQKYGTEINKINLHNEMWWWWSWNNKICKNLSVLILKNDKLMM